MVHPSSSLDRRHRFPGEIISHAVWLYFRFPLSYRDVEELLAERGVGVSYETIRRWCRKVGPGFADSLRRRRPRPGDERHLDEHVLKLNGQRRYLWRAVDQQGILLDILVQPRRNQPAAEASPRRLVHGQGDEPRVVSTDKTGRLPTRRAAHPATDGAPATQGAQRPGGALAPAHPPPRTRARALRVAGARAAVPQPLRPALRPRPPPPAPPPRTHLPPTAADSVRDLA
jgi:putative transposase